MYCKKCGNELYDADRFCKKCGTPVPVSAKTKKAEKTVITSENNSARHSKSHAKPLLIILAACILLGGGVLGYKVIFSGRGSDGSETSGNGGNSRNDILPIVNKNTKYTWIREAVAGGHRIFSETVYNPFSDGDVTFKTDDYKMFLPKFTYDRKEVYTYDAQKGVLKGTIQSEKVETDSLYAKYKETHTTETYDEHGFTKSYSNDDPSYDKNYGTTEYVYQKSSNTLLMKTTFPDHDTVVTSEMDANGNLLYRNEDGEYKISQTYEYDDQGNAVSYSEQYVQNNELFYSSSWTAENSYSEDKLISVRYSLSNGDPYQVNYTYDENGNLSCMSRNNSKNSFFYNEENLIIRKEVSEKDDSGKWYLTQVYVYEYLDAVKTEDISESEGGPDPDKEAGEDISSEGDTGGDKQEKTGKAEERSYRTERVSDNVEMNGDLCEIYYDQVILSSGYPQAEKINRYIEEKKNEFFSEAEKAAEEYLPENPFHEKLYNTITLDSLYENEEYISILLYENWFMGGVVNANPRAYTFDLKTGNAVNITDVLGMSVHDIRNLYISTVEKNGKSGNFLNYTSASDFKYCIKEGNTVYILFDTYEIGSGADGSFEMPIGTIESLKQ